MLTRADDGLTFLSKLGFRFRDDLTFSDGRFAASRTIVLDFGKGLLEWIACLIDAQNQEPVRHAAREFVLDRGTRELVVDGEKRRLTRLEYGVLEHLLAQAGLVVSRDELLNAVWGQGHAGSNVVDVWCVHCARSSGDTPLASRLS